MTKHKPRVNLYAIISRAVEEGVGYGWTRAHKHTNEPDREAAVEAIFNAVMSELCEVLEFGR